MNRAARRRAAERLSDMLHVHGPFVGDWCADCLESRKALLAVLGDPASFVVTAVNVVTGETVALGDVANLLPGGGQARPVGSLH
ncbi:MAG: thioredoxin/glutaredoxin-like protein [Bacteriophage sp.]|nr:MAG: thioredoxin/glutaredoxin-like protein [Bacteriophage sp.]